MRWRRAFPATSTGHLNLSGRALITDWELIGIGWLELAWSNSDAMNTDLRVAGFAKRAEVALRIEAVDKAMRMVAALVA